MAEPTELLTEAEHRAVALAAELWNLLCMDVVGRGRSRSGDLSELCAHIHAIQQAVLSQAAARAYPERYRLLGDEMDRLTQQIDDGPPSLPKPPRPPGPPPVG